MLLISQNMGNYDLELPKDAILRVNLAWCNTLNELKVILAKNKKSFRRYVQNNYWVRLHI